MADRKGHGTAGAIRSVKPAVRLILALACLVATAVWAGWLGMMHMAGQGSVLDRAEAVTVDLRLLVSGPLPPPTGVAIDDATVSNEGQYPLDRMRLATLINRTTNAGARGVAVDLLLLNKSTASADQALGNALGSVPSVIAGAALFGGQHQSRQPLPIATGVMGPCPVLALCAGRVCQCRRRCRRHPAPYAAGDRSTHRTRAYFSAACRRSCDRNGPRIHQKRGAHCW